MTRFAVRLLAKKPYLIINYLQNVRGSKIHFYPLFLSRFSPGYNLQKELYPKFLEAHPGLYLCAQ